jgi:flagellar M-ring protein FliF
MSAILKQLGELWKKLSSTQKTLVGAFVAIVVVGVVAAAFAGSAPSWVLLKDGLEPAELADALAKLDAADIRRKPGAARGEIYVDERDLDRAREVAAAQKLFAGGAADPEWEAAGSTSLGITEEQRRRRDLLAKQKNLATLLQTYAGVKKASVTLTPAVKAFSKRESSPAKAAVVLALEDGVALDGMQVQAMQYVVAAALPDLIVENVAVSDTRGILLSRGAGTAGYGGAVLERKRAAERHLAEKAQSALDVALGAGRAQVRVDVTLKNEALEETKRSVDAGTKVVLQEKSSSATGSSRAAGGVAGAAAQGAGATQQSAPGSSTEENSATYDYDRTETVRRIEGGDIVRRSVAVLLDAAYAADEAKVKKLVASAVGLDESDPKNGVIVVETLAFAPPKETAPEPEPGMDLGAILPLVRQVATAVLALGLAWWALRAVKSAKAAMAAAVREADTPAEAGEKRPVDPKTRVAEEIERDPANVGLMLRGWLYDGAAAR